MMVSESHKDLILGCPENSKRIYNKKWVVYSLYERNVLEDALLLLLG